MTHNHALDRTPDGIAALRGELVSGAGHGKR
jgi:hypothetical protein